jgi:hypothetical protein
VTQVRKGATRTRSRPSRSTLPARACLTT